MKALCWQPVPGEPGAEVYPWIRKPHCLSSNSYLVRTPEALAVIDPGGLPEQTAALADLVREELTRRPAPTGRGRWRSGPSPPGVPSVFPAAGRGSATS